MGVTPKDMADLLPKLNAHSIFHSLFHSFLFEKNMFTKPLTRITPFVRRISTVKPNYAFAFDIDGVLIKVSNNRRNENKY
jgi:hypothetical protein